MTLVAIESVKHSTLDKLKLIEDIRKRKLEYDKTRGELIDRKLIMRFIGKLYTVDTNELIPLGEKIGPIICAILGVKENEKILEVSKYIKDEIYKSLNHIKHIMNDFLKEIDAEEKDVSELD